MQLIENLKWRYATKMFDATKKVSEDKIDQIKMAIQLSASSYGQQPYLILEVKTPEVREALKPLCWNHAQIVDASHLFVFCNKIENTDEDVDDSTHLKSDIREISFEIIAGYGEFVKGKLKEKTKEEMFHWTAKQTYISLANALNACAELKVDSTPMEGFDAADVNELLGLDEKGLNASVLLAVGYRHEEDKAQHTKKVRKPLDEIFYQV